MQTATVSNRLGRWETPGAVVRTEQDLSQRTVVRENDRLAEENEMLRQSCADLTTAAETWIRLYESALARANAAEARIAQRTT